MKEKDFQTWWNNHCFYTSHPAYQICKSLHDAGADFPYLAKLIYRFLQEDLNNKLLKIFEKREHHLFRVVVQYHPSAPDEVKRFINQEVEQFKVYLDKAYHQEKVAQITKEFGESLDQMSERERLKPGFKKRMKKIDKLMQQMEPIIKYSPPASTSQGRAEDTWGSFLLLAVSEHLRGVTGKPNYLLAARLLRLLRGQQRSSGQKERAAAMMRVERLKKSHTNWESDLRKFKKLLQQNYERSVETFLHDPDYFKKSNPDLEKEDLENLKSIMDSIRPLIDLALVS